jgi:aldehyde:ferredoxin oxidoreductase
MPGCVIQCSNIYHDADGKEVVSPVEYETLGLLGTNCGISDPDDLAALNAIANDLGVDTIETRRNAGRVDGGRRGRVRRSCSGWGGAGRDPPGTEQGQTVGAGHGARRRALRVQRVPVIKKQAISAYDPRVVEATGIT